MRAVIGNVSYIGAAKDIIMQLKLEDYTKYNNLQEYQENIGRRVRLFNGNRISYSNNLEFLKELRRIGFLDSLEID